MQFQHRIAKTMTLQPAMHHIKRCGFLGHEQHGAAPAKLIGDDIGDRLALAGAGRADQHEIAPFGCGEHSRKL